MNLPTHMELYGITKPIFQKMNKHQKMIFNNSWRALKSKNVFNKSKLDSDLKELIGLFYDADFNVIYNEKDLMKNTPFASKAKD